MIPSKVQDVLAVLRKAGYEAYVAGGAARDLHYGRTPADWDIVLIGAVADVDAVHSKVYPLFSDFHCASSRHVNDDYLGEGGDERLEFVLQYSMPGVAIDILQYLEGPESIEDQLRMFDCNLSFFWIEDTGEVRYLPDAHTISKAVCGDTVVFTAGERYTIPRRDQLKIKFPELRFPTDAELYQQLTKGQ